MVNRCDNFPPAEMFSIHESWKKTQTGETELKAESQISFNLFCRREASFEIFDVNMR